MNLPFDDWLPQQRWYGGRSRQLVSAAADVVVPLRDDIDLVLLRVDYAEGRPERYQILVRWGTAPIDEYSAVARIGSDTASDSTLR